MRSKWLLLAATAALLACALGVLYIRERTQAAAPRKPAAAQASVPAEVVLPGKIRAQTVVPVAAPVEGALEAVLVSPGDPVYEGQVLCRIKNTALDSEEQAAKADVAAAQERLSQLESQLIVARAEASRARSDAARVQSEFDRAERAYLRQQMLLKEGATPRLVYEKSQKEYEAVKGDRDIAAGLARAAEDRVDTLVKNVDAVRLVVDEKNQVLEKAKLASAAAELRSPLNGLVVGITRQPGEEVTPAIEDLFRIAVDLAALEAAVDADPKTLALVQPGQDALITTVEAADAIPAKVTAIQGNQVLIRFTSPNPAVRPGTTAEVRIRVAPGAPGTPAAAPVAIR